MALTKEKSEETSCSSQLRQVAASWPTQLSQEQSVRHLLDKLLVTRQKTLSLTAEEARETVISVPGNINFSLHKIENRLMSHLPTREDRKRLLPWRSPAPPCHQGAADPSKKKRNSERPQNTLRPSTKPVAVSEYS